MHNNAQWMDAQRPALDTPAMIHGRQAEDQSAAGSQRQPPTDAGHAAQVAVLKWLGLGRLQLPRLRIQHACQVPALLLCHLHNNNANGF